METSVPLNSKKGKVNIMTKQRLTLSEIAKELAAHVDTFGDCYVASFGFNNDNFYIVTVCDEIGMQTELKIPKYERTKSLINRLNL